MGSQATRRGVPAPAALERLREYLRHDASEADVAVAFAGGGAAALLRRVEDCAAAAARGVPEAAASLASAVACVRALVERGDGLERFARDPALVARLSRALDAPRAATRAAALELLAVVAAHSPAGHAAVVLALHYFRAATGEGAAFEGLVQAVGDATAATALRRDVLLFVNTLVNAAPDLADRAELRAQLHSAGLGRALAGVAAAVGGGGADADAAAAEELEAQLRVYEAVAADDAQRVAAAAGAAGEALRLDDEAALLKAWTARATRRGAGKEARALARYLACLPLDDARGRDTLAAIVRDVHRRALGARDDFDAGLDDMRRVIDWRRALDERARSLADATAALDRARARTDIWLSPRRRPHTDPGCRL